MSGVGNHSKLTAPVTGTVVDPSHGLLLTMTHGLGSRAIWIGIRRQSAGFDAVETAGVLDAGKKEGGTEAFDGADEMAASVQEDQSVQHSILSFSAGVHKFG